MISVTWEKTEAKAKAQKKSLEETTRKIPKITQEHRLDNTSVIPLFAFILLRVNTFDLSWINTEKEYV